MNILKYGDPIIVDWYVDDRGNKISKSISNESLTVVDNKATLVGLPDEYKRVKIDGMHEISIDKEIQDETESKVDYKQTRIGYFHPKKNGSTIVVNEYWSRGITFYPASRVWLEVDDAGNILVTIKDALGAITELVEILPDMDEIREEVKRIKEEYEILLQQGIDADKALRKAVEDANQAKIDLINKTNELEVKITDLINQGNTTVAELTDLINQVTILKNEVNTLQEQVEASMAELKNIQTEIEALVQKADELHTYFVDNLEDIEKLKNDLIDLTDRGTDVIDTITPLIASGNQVISSLQKEITDGNKLKAELTALMQDGNTLLGELTAINSITSTLIIDAKAINTTLLATTTAANNSNTSLEDAIRRAQALLDEINNIIEGTDFEGVLNRLDALEKEISYSTTPPSSPIKGYIWIKE